MSGATLYTGNKLINKTNKNPSHHRAYILIRVNDDKNNKVGQLHTILMIGAKEKNNKTRKELENVG